MKYVVKMKTRDKALQLNVREKPKGQSRMDNTETHATLCTQRRTKTNKATTQHRELNKEENGPLFPFLISHSISLNRNKVKKKTLL